LWREDLREFIKKLDEVEQKQLEDQQVTTKKGAKKKDGARKKVALMPSPDKGTRIVPKISDELKRKASAAVAAKDKKAAKNAFGKSLNAKMAEFDEPDEFDDMADDKEHNRSLSDRLGFNLKAEEKAKKSKVVRSTDRSEGCQKISTFFQPALPKKESSNGSVECSDDDEAAKPLPAQEAKKKPKKLQNMFVDSSDDGEAAKPPRAKKAKRKPKKLQNMFADSSDKESRSGSEFDVNEIAPERESSEIAPPRERPGRARKNIQTYKIEDSSDSESESLEDFA